MSIDLFIYDLIRSHPRFFSKMFRIFKFVFIPIYYIILICIVPMFVECNQSFFNIQYILLMLPFFLLWACRGWYDYIEDRMWVQAIHAVASWFFYFFMWFMLESGICYGIIDYIVNDLISLNIEIQYGIVPWGLSSKVFTLPIYIGLISIAPFGMKIEIVGFWFLLLYMYAHDGWLW